MSASRAFPRHIVIALVLIVLAALSYPTAALAATPTPSIAAQIPLPPFPQFLAVNSETNRAYVAHLTDSISVVDLAARTVIATIPTPPGLVGIAVDPNRNRIYATSLRADTLTIVDGSTNEVVATVAVPNTPLLLAADPVTGRVYIAAQSEVDVVDGTTLQRIFVPGARTITGIGIDPSNGHVYATDQTTHEVYVLDAATNALLTSIPVPPGTYTPLDVDPATHRVFVVSSDSRILSVIDSTTNTIVAQTSFPAYPSGVAFEPGTNTIFVTNPGIAWLEVVDGTTYARGNPLSFISIGNISHGIAVNTKTHLIYAIGLSFSGESPLVEVTQTPRDTTPPAITAPANITTDTAAGTCGRAVTYAFTASDDSGTVDVRSTPPSGSTFPEGTTTVTGTATDPAGNSASATFTVTVSDSEAPAILAPGDITVLASNSSGAVVPNLGNPTASDNCPGVSTGVAGVPTGNAFPIGSTTLTWTATDASGNSAHATQLVTVRYRVCPLYDVNKAKALGSTVPIKLQLCATDGTNLSSTALAMHATGVTKVSDTTSGVLDDSGNANPDGDFRYDATLGGSGGYIYNLSSKGLSRGSWTLDFIVGGEPYAIPFQLD